MATSHTDVTRLGECTRERLAEMLVAEAEKLGIAHALTREVAVAMDLATYLNTALANGSTAVEAVSKLVQALDAMYAKAQEMCRVDHIESTRHKAAVLSLLTQLLATYVERLVGIAESLGMGRAALVEIIKAWG